MLTATDIKLAQNRKIERAARYEKLVDRRAGLVTAIERKKPATDQAAQDVAVAQQLLDVLYGSTDGTRKGLSREFLTGGGSALAFTVPALIPARDILGAVLTGAIAAQEQRTSKITAELKRLQDELAKVEQAIADVEAEELASTL